MEIDRDLFQKTIEEIEQLLKGSGESILENFCIKFLNTFKYQLLANAFCGDVTLSEKLELRFNDDDANGFIMNRFVFEHEINNCIYKIDDLYKMIIPTQHQMLLLQTTNTGRNKIFEYVLNLFKFFRNKKLSKFTNNITISPTLFIINNLKRKHEDDDYEYEETIDGSSSNSNTSNTDEEDGSNNQLKMKIEFDDDEKPKHRRKRYNSIYSDGDDNLNDEDYVPSSNSSSSSPSHSSYSTRSMIDDCDEDEEFNDDDEKKISIFIDDIRIDKDFLRNTKYLKKYKANTVTRKHLNFEQYSNIIYTDDGKKSFIDYFPEIKNQNKNNKFIYSDLPMCTIEKEWVFNLTPEFENVWNKLYTKYKPIFVSRYLRTITNAELAHKDNLYIPSNNFRIRKTNFRLTEKKGDNDDDEANQKCVYDVKKILYTEVIKFQNSNKMISEISTKVAAELPIHCDDDIEFTNVKEMEFIFIEIDGIPYRISKTKDLPIDEYAIEVEVSERNEMVLISTIFKTITEIIFLNDDNIPDNWHFINTVINNTDDNGKEAEDESKIKLSSIYGKIH